MTKKSGVGRPKKVNKAERVISFRLTDELYKELVRYAEGQEADAGGTLSPTAAARKLLRGALKSLEKKGAR